MISGCKLETDVTSAQLDCLFQKLWEELVELSGFEFGCPSETGECQTLSFIIDVIHCSHDPVMDILFVERMDVSRLEGSRELR